MDDKTRNSLLNKVDAGGYETGIRIVDGDTGEVKYVPDAEARANGITPLYNGTTLNLYKNTESPIGYSSVEPNKVKIDLDKNTGDIKVTAPSYLANRDVYKNNIIPMLESISSDYKRNPETRYGRENSDETDSIEDKINEIQKSLAEDYVPAAEQMQKGIDAVKAQYDIDMTDDDYIKRTTLAVRTKDANGNIIDPKDTDLQVIPVNLMDKKFLATLDTYDSTNNTVAFGELKDKFWSRIDNTEEELWDFYVRTKELANDPNADKQDRIEAMAMLDFMQDQNPEMDFWNGVGDFFEGIWNGFFNKGFQQAAITVESVAENVTNGLQNLVSGSDDYQNTLGKELQKNLDDWMAEYEEKKKILSADSENVGDFIGNIGFIALETMAANKAASSILAGASNIATSTAARVALAVEGLAETLTEAEKLTRGAQILLNIVGKEKAISLMASAVNVLNGTANAANVVAGTLEASSAVGKIASGTTRLVAESIAEAFCTRPDLVRKLVTTSDSMENGQAVRDAVLEELAYNAGGWAAGLGIGKLLTGFSNSTIGKAISLNQSSKKINKAIAVTKGPLEKARVSITAGSETISDVVKNAKRANKAYAIADRTLTRDLRAGLSKVEKIHWVKKALTGKMDELSEDVIKGLEKQTETVKAFSNALDDFTSNCKLSVAEFKSASKEVNISLEYGKYMDSVSDVIKQEDALAKAGNTMFQPIAKKAGDMAENAGIMSQVTTNYIGAKKTLEYWTKWGEDVNNKVDDAIRETIAEAESQIKMFTDNASAELKASVDSLIANNKVLWNKLEDVYTYYGVENTAAILGKRESGYMGVGGEDYYLVQRKNQLSEYKYSRANGEIPVRQDIDEWGYKMVKGAKGDYVDPSIVLQDSLQKHAVLKNRNDLVKAFHMNDINPAAVLINSTDTEYVRKMKSSWGKNGQTLEGEFKEKSKQAVEKFGEDLKTSDTLDNLFDSYKEKSVVLEAESKTNKAASNLAKAKLSNPNVTKADRLNYINSMPDLLAEDFMKESGINPLKYYAENAVTSEEWEKYINDLPSQSRTFLKKQIAETSDIFDTAETMGLTKKDFPKMSLEDYYAATGYTKWADVPKEYRPYLKKGGMPADEALRSVKSGFAGDISELDEAFGDSLQPVDEFFEILDSVQAPNKLSIYNQNDVINAVSATNGWDEFNKITLANSKAAMNNKDFIEYIDAEVKQFKRDEIVAKANTIFQDALSDYRRVAGASAAGDFKQLAISNIDEFIGDRVDEILADPAMNKVLEAVSTKYGIELDDNMKQYFALKALEDNKKSIMEKVNSSFRRRLSSIRTKENAKELEKARGRLYNEYTQMIEDELDEKWNAARSIMLNTNPEFVDVQDYFKEMRKIINGKDGIIGINQAKQMSDVIMTTNSKGEATWMQVNPVLADLLNSAKQYVEPGILGKFNYITNRIFRMGTTGPLAIRSLTNQMFKDNFNAYIGGGAWIFSKTVGNMTDEFGEQVVKFIQENEPLLYERLAKQAKETGDNIARLAVENEFAFGKELAQASERTVQEQLNLENRYTKFINGEKKKGDILDNAINRMDNWFKNSDNPLNPDKINQWRESTLRSNVYQQNFYDAMKRGLSVKDAREAAQYAMSNATTNFSRKTAFLSSIQSTTPYFGAAINGTRSFWRLASMDPVGVFGRLTAGLIVPTIGLTVASLADERNRDVYNNLREYQKEGNLIFVLNGQVLSIPVPEELSFIVSPIRQMIETMYGTNKRDFWDLATNDIIGISPIDLSGFTDTDAYNLTNDPEWYKRIDFSRGVTKLASQLMPPALKTVVMANTGIDPYTGKKINTAYKQYDPETGDFVVMGDQAGQFSELAASLFGDSVNPKMFEKILEGIVGIGGSDFLDTLVNYGRLATGNAAKNDIFSSDATPGFAVEKVINRAAIDPLTVQVYGRAESDWKQTISALYDEKNQLITSDAFRSAVQATQNATSVEAKEKAFAAYNNLITPFYDKVKSAIDNLNTRYGAQFNGTKFASVISLLNMSSNLPIAAGNEYLSSISQDMKRQGKAQAVETMISMGFKSPSDTSIFGKILYSNTNGDTYINYTSPLAILESENQLYYYGDVHQANIDAMLKPLKGRKEAINKQIDAIYDSKKKLTNADYNKIDAIRMTWNAEVMQAIAPYIKQYGTNEVLTNDIIYGSLADYILVPGEYEKTNYGKTISASRLNKQYGFIKSYVQAIFKEDK